MAKAHWLYVLSIKEHTEKDYSSRKLIWNLPMCHVFVSRYVAEAILLIWPETFIFCCFCIKDYSAIWILKKEKEKMYLFDHISQNWYWFFYAFDCVTYVTSHKLLIFISLFFYWIKAISKHSNCPGFARTVQGFGMLSQCLGLNQFVPVFAFFTKKFLHSHDFPPAV